MRVLFMGTPEYGQEVLKTLCSMVESEAIRVVSQPDRPQGRHRRLQSSPVSEYAVSHGLTLDRPEKLSQFREPWAQFAPDLIVTAAYGRVLPPWLLNLPKRALNLHASLLPRWRGANPIAWAIYEGDVETGVSLMEMRQGLDQGPVLVQSALAIFPEDTRSTLSARLARAAGQLLEQAWQEILDLPATPQREALATVAPKFDRSMARVDWTQTAVHEARRIRSLTTDPGAYAICSGRRIGLGPARVEPGVMVPGQIRLEGDAWQVGCAKDTLVLSAVRPEGRSWMTPAAFVRGFRGDLPRTLS